MFSVELDAETIERSDTGSITGTVWMRMDEIAFPEPGWNDFIVVVLGWWTNEAAALIAGTKTSGEFMFMDGPFTVSVAPVGDSWRLECNRRRKNGVVREHEASATAGEVTTALVIGADAVLGVCAKKGWQSKDIEELRSGRAALVHAAGANIKGFVDPQL
jgi:hypothetical protein